MRWCCSSSGRAVRPDVVLDAASMPVVVELCRRLDGIPLAIELAAARVATMTPAEIVGHLDERFRLLTGGRRGRVERHQTLRAAVEWSYSLLDDTERTVFDRLGVFPASFDEAAAVAVCVGEGIERWDVIDALASLAAKSMIGAEQSESSTRHQLLETLRHFARDRAGHLDELRRRHAVHFAAFAERAGVGLASPDELAWKQRLAVEIDNLRAAVDWSVDGGQLADLNLGVGIIEALLGEAVTTMAWGIHSWALPVLRRAGELDGPRRATISAASSVHFFNQGDIAQGRDLGRRAVADSAAFTNAYFAAMLYSALADVLLGEPVAAVATIAAGQRLLMSETDPAEWQRCRMQIAAASIHGFLGDHAAARAAAAGAVVEARRSGLPSFLAGALTVYGHYQCEVDPQEADRSLGEAIGLFESLGGGSIYPGALMDMAVLRAAEGDVPRAADLARTSVEHFVRDGYRQNLADALSAVTTIFAEHYVGGDAAATVDGARHGPVLGQLLSGFLAPHRSRVEVARERVAADLGADAYEAARHRGAAMTYDEIVAYTLDQLGRMADSRAAPLRGLAAGAERGEVVEEDVLAVDIDPAEQASARFPRLTARRRAVVGG